MVNIKLVYFLNKFKYFSNKEFTSLKYRKTIVTIIFYTINCFQVLILQEFNFIKNTPVFETQIHNIITAFFGVFIILYNIPRLGNLAWEMAI